MIARPCQTDADGHAGRVGCDIGETIVIVNKFVQLGGDLMRLVSLIGCLLMVAGTAAAPALGDEAAVKKMIQDYAAAFNGQQIDAVMGFWTESGVHLDRDTGERTEGRDEIRKDIAESFQQSPGAKISGRIVRVRFIQPDVASVEGQVTVSDPGEAPLETDFYAILVNQNDRWMISEIEEMSVPLPTTSYDALRELDWLVGSWVDQSSETRVDNVVRWSANNAFLLRSFVVQAAESEIQQGTQIIGWDPRSQEIRSWSFNSDGSFGDATWSRNGEDWLIKSSQTLADGQAASGTFVLSRNGDNELTVQLIGHEIEGEPQPTESAVTMVRSDEPSPDTASQSVQPTRETGDTADGQ